MGPEALAHVLRPLGLLAGASPDLLVGLAEADDAAVYRLSEHQAIVATVDFFPPVVDDAYTFGAVAAANALSDIYAMGARPLLCLNLVAWPATLDAEILGEVMRGGSDKVREAGAVLAGGHSVLDQEPKYGLVALGTVEPDRVWTKRGARPGDALLLTKPLGTGILTTALKNEALAEADLAAVTASMMTLNASAAQALASLGGAVHAATDVTGFGLAGHASEIARHSEVCLSVSLSALPLLPHVREYATQGHVPGGTDRNREGLAQYVSFAEGISEDDQLIVCDPQTSGGLLAVVDASQVEAALTALDAVGVPVARIGSVVAGSGVRVER